MAKASRTEHNLKVLRDGCREFLLVKKKKQLVAILTDLATKLVNYIESEARIPEYSSNLRDATGVGVYVDGALISYVPTKRATKNQKSGFHYRNEYGIDGSAYLTQAIVDASTRFAKGIWIVLFSAVPYAYFLNKPELVGNLRGKVEGNFFGEIADKMLSDITSGLAPLKPVNVPVLKRNETI